MANWIADIKKLNARIDWLYDKVMCLIREDSGQGSGQSINQDNITIVKEVKYLDNPDPLNVRILAAINSVAPFTVDETEEVIYSVFPSLSNTTETVINYKYKMTYKGKGNYGLGQIQLTWANLELIYSSPATFLDVEQLPTTQIVDEGWDITGTDISAFVNVLNPPYEFQSQNLGYVLIKALNNGLTESYLFTGAGGVYGLGQLQTTIMDFQLLEDEVVVLRTSQLINDGSDGTSYYVEQDDLDDQIDDVYDEIDLVGVRIDNLTTSVVPEGTRLYFTQNRVLATVLSTINFAITGSIVPTDSIVDAFAKIRNSLISLAIDISLRELLSNKQNNRNVDGSGTKYPTIDVLNNSFAPYDAIYTRLMYDQFFKYSANGTTGMDSTGAIPPTSTGTVSNGSIVYGPIGMQVIVNTRKHNTANTAGSSATIRESSFHRINAGQGYYLSQRIKNSDAAIIPDVRFLYGLAGTSAFPNINPSAYTAALIGFGADSSDTNMQLIYKLDSFPASKINLGSSFLKNSSDDFFLEIWKFQGSPLTFYKATNFTNGAIQQGSVTHSAVLTFSNFKNNGSSNAIAGFDFVKATLHLSEQY